MIYNNKDSFESLNAITGRVAVELGIERGLREIAFINLWPNIIGSRFSDKSKAVSVINKNSHDVLLVAVSSSVVSQELFLFKKDILRRIAKVAKSLNFNVRDLIFSHKIWEEEKYKPALTQKNEKTAHYFVKNPSDEEIKNISVPENIINLIKESIQYQKFSSDDMKDRMLHTIIKDIKIQIWRKNNGFPYCKKCGIPVNYYNPDQETLCPSCKYSK